MKLRVFLAALEYFVKTTMIIVLSFWLLTTSAAYLVASEYISWHQALSQNVIHLNNRYFRLRQAVNNETGTIIVDGQLCCEDVDGLTKFTHEKLAQVNQLQAENLSLLQAYLAKFPPSYSAEQDETYSILKSQQIALKELANHLAKLDLFFDFLSASALVDHYKEQAMKFYDAKDWCRAEIVIDHALNELEKQKRIEQQFRADLGRPLPELESYLIKHEDFLLAVRAVLDAKERGRLEASDQMIKKATDLSLDMIETFPLEDLHVYWEVVLVDRETTKAEARLLAEIYSGS